MKQSPFCVLMIEIKTNIEEKIKQAKTQSP